MLVALQVSKSDSQRGLRLCGEDMQSRSEIGESVAEKHMLQLGFI